MMGDVRPPAGAGETERATLDFIVDKLDELESSS